MILGMQGLFIAVYVLSIKYRKLHVYGMLCVYTMSLTIICIAQIVYMNYEDKTQTEIALKRNYDTLSRIFTLSCFLTIPNTKWLLIYLAIYAAAFTVLTFIYWERTDIFKETLSDQLKFILAGSFVFHLI